MTEIAPYRPFHVRVAATTRLSPSFLRVTFTGDDVQAFGDHGYDQRIKVMFPLPEHGLADLSDGGDWYQRWRELPQERRNPIRTYTAREVRRGRGEFDVDFVLHGDGGPASAWAQRAAAGDSVVIVGPDGRYEGPPSGLHWCPGAATRLLLAGDETAVPAVCAIAERLPAGAVGRILLEVPEPEDALGLHLPPGVRVDWLPRDGRPHGELLEPAVIQALADLGVSGGEGSPVEDVDVDTDILWETPEDTTGEFYAWLAGEAGVVKRLRRHLVQEAGVPRAQVAFMGYWRHGRAEPQ
ncbi:siderophore-interacting protein [Nonomuraea sp. NPDC046570]|uniref:siderophore-interacting protein n=1 Tax=Nonomuraea sp. NPDC046570 TaxID=3155255 RepID=UPI0033ED1E1C